ncbi:MAG: insulinase family protein, partial [Pseudomonadota bacterium]
MSARRLTAVLIAVGLLMLPPASGAESRPGVTRHVLENGLTVIMKENPQSDLVVTEAIVRAGARVEESRQAGITFFVRAMVLRGTGRRSAGDIAETIESVGGQLGGGTT